MKPDFSRHLADPSFDPYRDRVAQLFRDGREAGLAFVRVEAWAEVLSGRWWWKTWSRSVDVPHIFFVVDGDYSDTVAPWDANAISGWRSGGEGASTTTGRRWRLDGSPPRSRSDFAEWSSALRPTDRQG
jgi:hypothetical protein